MQHLLQSLVESLNQPIGRGMVWSALCAFDAQFPLQLFHRARGEVGRLICDDLIWHLKSWARAPIIFDVFMLWRGKVSWNRVASSQITNMFW